MSMVESNAKVVTVLRVATFLMKCSAKYSFLLEIFNFTNSENLDRQM